mgnify:CR=1 FL=1
MTYSSETLQDSAASYQNSPLNEETSKSLADHRQDINCCVAALKDVLEEYVESQTLTAGEFVDAVKTALNDLETHHESRLKVLKDAHSLLVGAPKYDKTFITEKFNHGTGSY